MKTALKTALCGVAAATALSLSVSAGEREPQVGAYLSWAFGNTQQPVMADSFHYGMRLDYYQPGFGPVAATPLLKFGVENGRFDTYLNGASLTAIGTRLNQAESGGLFGSAGMTAAVVVAGVAGAAVAINSASDDDDDDPPGGTTGGGAGGDTGASTGGGTGGTTGGGTGGWTGGLIGRGYRAEYGVDAGLAIERQRMLDGGTGYMGDLIARD